MVDPDSKTLTNEFMRFANTIKTQTRDVQFSARQIELALYYIESAIFTIPPTPYDIYQLETRLVRVVLQKEKESLKAVAAQLKNSVQKAVNALSENGSKALADEAYFDQRCMDQNSVQEARQVIATSLAELKKIDVTVPLNLR